MWGKRNAQNGVSTLRYCQTAHELPLRDLFETPRLTVAIAQTCRRVDIPADSEEERYALGILHIEGNVWWDGSADPLLPCKIHFGTGYGDDRPFGRAWLDFMNDAENPHYRLEIAVEDEGDIFAKIETAIGHAKLSNRSFLHATFVKPREPGPHKPTGQADWEERTANRKALAQRIEDGSEKPADILLASVWFDDRINAVTPVWATAWHDADTLEGKQFHDPNVRKARLRRKLPPPRRKP